MFYGFDNWNRLKLHFLKFKVLAILNFHYVSFKSPFHLGSHNDFSVYACVLI